ncbi:copper-binding transcription factor [Monascus purpureus]|uniref:Copper-binding transcription factor n=1 Tax=Monascus purpureus TaxID=5098 RepID=A0A507QS73_MONPU|nr:copper-binding transcription factor [Monascus purpureus]
MSSLTSHPLISSFSELALYALLLISSIMFELWKTTDTTRQTETVNTQPCGSFKRPMSPNMLNEGVERSMARRRKDAPPMNINAKCSHCDKVFRRPCDLTKHEKTHSRPWKCTEPSCRYYEVGWPTEKERDRHINDKHSRSPTMYKCLYAPCPYQSKRESNCKQHMEKTHGWAYVRSKNNSKGGSSSRGSPTESIPASTRMTPASTRTTPSTPSLPTPGPTTPFSIQEVDCYNTPLVTTDNFPEPLMPMTNEDFQLFSDPTLFGGSLANFNFASFGPIPPAIPELVPELEHFCAQPQTTNEALPEAGAFSLGLHSGQGDIMLYTPGSPWPDDDGLL